MRPPREHIHPDADALRLRLKALNLSFMLDNDQALAQTAADKHWSHLDYLLELVSGETAARDADPQNARPTRALVKNPSAISNRPDSFIFIPAAAPNTAGRIVCD